MVLQSESCLQGFASPIAFWNAFCMLGAKQHQKGVKSRTDRLFPSCYNAAAGHQEQQEEEASQAEEGDGHSEEAGSQGKLQPTRQLCCCAAAQRSSGTTTLTQSLYSPCNLPKHINPRVIYPSPPPWLFSFCCGPFSLQASLPHRIVRCAELCREAVHAAECAV